MYILRIHIVQLRYCQEQNNHLAKLIRQLRIGVERRLDDAKTFILLYYQKQLRSVKNVSGYLIQNHKTETTFI